MSQVPGQMDEKLVERACRHSWDMRFTVHEEQNLARLVYSPREHIEKLIGRKDLENGESAGDWGQRGVINDQQPPQQSRYRDNGGEPGAPSARSVGHRVATDPARHGDRYSGILQPCKRREW